MGVIWSLVFLAGVMLVVYVLLRVRNGKFEGGVLKSEDKSEEEKLILWPYPASWEDISSYHEKGKIGDLETVVTYKLREGFAIEGVVVRIDRGNFKGEMGVIVDHGDRGPIVGIIGDEEIEKEFAVSSLSYYAVPIVYTG